MPSGRRNLTAAAVSFVLPLWYSVYPVLEKVKMRVKLLDFGNSEYISPPRRSLFPFIPRMALGGE